MSLMDIRLPKAVKVNIDGKEHMVYPADEVDIFTAEVTTAMMQLVQESKSKLGVLDEGLNYQTLQLQLIEQRYTAYIALVDGLRKLLPVMRSNPDKRMQAFLPDLDALLAKLYQRLAE